MILKNCKINTLDNEFEIFDIKISNGIIKEISKNINSDDDEIIDLKNLLVIAGGIDVHTHLREPGFEYKEDIISGTKSAAAGGYTTIFTMGNLKPSPDNITDILNYENLIKQKSLVKIHQICNVSKNQLGKELIDFDEICSYGFRYFSDDGKGIQDDNLVLKAMKNIKKHNAFLITHAEDEKFIDKFACVHKGVVSDKFNLVGIPSEAEFSQIKRDLEFIKQIGVKYHICHMSTKESVELLKDAMSLGLDVSGEVSTHHLLLCEDDIISDDGNFKMNPPLRSKMDKDALIDGLKNNIIKIIANDHAPHAEFEKNKGLKDSMFGIISLQTSIPLLISKFVIEDKIFTLQKLREFISINPAKRFELDRVGDIKVGNFADLVVLEEGNFKIDKDRLFSKSKNTPFHNYDVKVKITKTFINGKLIYDNGEFYDKRL